MSLPRPIDPDPSPQGYGRTGTSRTWNRWHALIDEDGARTGKHVADDIVRACAHMQWAALPALAREAATWAIVRPSGTVALREIGNAITGAAEHLSMPDDALAALAMFDLLNIVNCIGGDFTGKVPLTSFIPQLARLSTQWTATERIRICCAAWMHRDLQAFAMLRGPERPYDQSLTRVGPDALVPYLVAAASQQQPRPRAWTFVLNYLDELTDEALIDPETVLFLARVVTRAIVPMEDVAKDLHDHLATVVRGQELIEPQRWYQTSPPHRGPGEPPLTDTIANGAYQIDEHVFGVRRWRQYLGHRIAQPTERVVVSCLTHGTPKAPLDQLRSDLAYSVPGVLELAFFGPLDVPETAERRKELAEWCVLVERLPSGETARRAIRDAIGAHAAVKLGLAVGAIVERALRAAVPMAALRPEYIWIERDPRGEWTPTGITGRNGAFFASHKFSHYPSNTPFLRPYGAPEADHAPTDRSPVFTLATLIAEWTTGRYPFLGAWDRGSHLIQLRVDQPDEPDLRGVPPQLAELLACGLRRDPATRPGLVEWLHELSGLVEAHQRRSV